MVELDENVWTEDGEPLTFATKAEATEALREHLADSREAYKAGNISSPDRRADFVIVRVE